MSKKQAVIEALFRECQAKNAYVFDNAQVKAAAERESFKNAFDATKIDHSEKLPPLLHEHDYFISHLGKGRHQFVKGIKYGYHQLEAPQKTIEWQYKKSVLNDTDSSESNILSLCANQLILNDFLYEDLIAPARSYNARRTNRSLCYRAGTTELVLAKIQMEIDMTMEQNGEVTIFEAKNKFHKDFATYQLFHPFLHYHHLKQERGLAIKQVNCCYLSRAGNKVRLHLYTFSDLEQIDSIELIKAHEYELIGAAT